MKILALADQTGIIVSVVETRDPTFVPDPTLHAVDITHLPQIHQVQDAPDYFTVINKKIVEKSEGEKAQARDKRHPPRQNAGIDHVIQRLDKLEGRLQKIEAKGIAKP